MANERETGNEYIKPDTVNEQVPENFRLINDAVFDHLKSINLFHKKMYVDVKPTPLQAEDYINLENVDVKGNDCLE